MHTPLQRARFATDLPSEPLARRPWFRAPSRSHLAAMALVVAYALALLPNILSSNYAPDEIWFAHITASFRQRLAELGVWRYIIAQDNHLGYGPIYWMAQTFLTRASAHPLMASRLFSLLCFLTVPVALLASWPRTMSGPKWLALLLWLTFPVAWWTGKLIGPELPSVAAGAVGLAFLTYPDHTRRFVGWMALGIAVGIKATAAPLLIFAGILTWPTRASWRAAWTVAVAGTALGFVISSPTAVIGPRAYFSAMRAARGTDPLDIPSWPKHIAARLDTDSWTWDALPNGGLMQWSLGLVPLLAFAILLFASKPKARIPWAFATAATVSLGLCLTSQQYYGWYWFGTLLIFPFAWIAQTRWSPASFVGAAGLVLVNALCNAPDIAQRYAHKMEQARITENKATIQQCVEHAARNLSGIDTVLDYSELTLDLDYAFLAKPAPLEAVVPAGRIAFWIMGYLPLPPLGGEALMLVGDRLKRVHAPAVSPQELAGKIDGAKQVEFIQACDGMNLYKVVLQKT